MHLFTHNLVGTFHFAHPTTRTIKQGFALRSSRLFIPQLLTKKISPTSGLYFLLMAGLTLTGSNFLKDIITMSIALIPRKYAI